MRCPRVEVYRSAVRAANHITGGSRSGGFRLVVRGTAVCAAIYRLHASSTAQSGARIEVVRFRVDTAQVVAHIFSVLVPVRDWKKVGGVAVEAAWDDFDAAHIVRGQGIVVDGVGAVCAPAH